MIGFLYKAMAQEPDVYRCTDATYLTLVRFKLDVELSKKTNHVKSCPNVGA